MTSLVGIRDVIYIHHVHLIIQRRVGVGEVVAERSSSDVSNAGAEVA